MKAKSVKLVLWNRKSLQVQQRITIANTQDKFAVNSSQEEINISKSIDL